MENKTLLCASVTGTITPKDGVKSETYKFTVVYSDGSKAVLPKKYEEFVSLQVMVYDLLKKEGGYSKKASRTRISCFPENASAFSRILFKDSELKKMGRMDNFIKELLALPSFVRESEVVLKFFSALDGQHEGTVLRSSEEEKLKNVNKVAEILSGRDPLRNIPEKSPLAKRMRGYGSNGIAGDLPVSNEETRDQLYRKTNKQNKRHSSDDILMITSKSRATSLHDEILDKSVESLRPDLKMRSFSVGAVNLISEREHLKKRKPDENSSSQSSGDDKSISVQCGSSAIDFELSEVKETRPSLEEKSSLQIGSRNSDGRGSPSRKKHVVLRSFFSEESGEVSLEEGEEVDVLQKESSGWWYVKNDFCEGWAPSAFLAPGRSRSISPESLDQQQISDKQDDHWQIKEGLDSWPRQKRDEPKRLVPQGKEKSPDRNPPNKVTAQTKTSEMNPRAKLLTVEGIQKRKNPDKNYVYILKVVWSDGKINIIYRTCSDFFFLQLLYDKDAVLKLIQNSAEARLKEEFPTAIGNELPALKGRKFSENCQFCFKDATCKRQSLMNQFCHELINAPDNISKSKVVMDFCRSRVSDIHPHGESTKIDGKTTENDEKNKETWATMMFEQYVVTADYQKKNKNDISLTAGDIIDVIERNDCGWWLVDREGELGWAPASHLQPTVNGPEITTPEVFASAKDSHEQDDSPGVSPTPAKRRSMIQRTACKIPKRKSMELKGTPGGEEGNHTIQLVSEAATANTSTINSKALPSSTDVSALSRSSPQTPESTQRESDSPFQSSASLSSHESSDVFTEEHCTNGMKKYASLPLLNSVDSGLEMSRPSLAMPRSKPATSLELHKNEMELSVNGVHSKSKHSSSGGNSPAPPQRKISSNRSIPQACFCQRRRDSGFVSLFKTSPRVSRSEIENDFHYENQEKNTAYPRFYRAIYTYNSQDDGEVAFREGDEVEVIRRSENGWWLVRTSEELGWGPSNFLQSLAY